MSYLAQHTTIAFDGFAIAALAVLIAAAGYSLFKLISRKREQEKLENKLSEDFMEREEQADIG